MQDRTAYGSLTPKVMDQETLEFAQKVFEFVRSGHVEMLRPLLAQGLPANLRNQRGDSLLMLASYHGHLDTARALLEHGGDPELPNDMGQTPLPGRLTKATLRWSVCSWNMVPRSKAHLPTARPP